MLRIMACLAISCVSLCWVTLAGGTFSVEAAIFLLILPWVLLQVGQVFTRLTGFPSFFSFDFLLGFILVSTGFVVWKLVVPISLWALLAILVLGAGTLSVLKLSKAVKGMSEAEFLAVAISLVAATGWSQDLLAPTRATPDVVIFKPWSDFFFHATIVTRSLSAKTLPQAGSFEWYGLPALVYHYGSYSLAVFLVKVSKVTSYVSVVGFWTPFGSFLSGLSAFALGRLFWNDVAGLAAMAGVMLIPDPGLLHIGHPYYAYFWLQHIDPGGLYGVTVAGTALGFVALGVHRGRRSWILCGALLASLTGFFKAHILAAAFPITFSLVVVGWPPRRRRQWVWLGLCVLGGVVFVQLMNHYHVGPGVAFDFSGGDWYWTFLQSKAKGTPVESWYRVFTAGTPVGQYFIRALALLLISALGIFAIAGPAMWIAAAARREWQVSESLSVGAGLILILMTFGLGRNAMLGLPDELIHRPFVWAYWLVGALTAGRVCAALWNEASRYFQLYLSVGTVVLCAVPAYYGRGLQQGKWPGASEHYDTRVDAGLVESAKFIRSQPGEDTIVQNSNLEDWFPTLQALSERPSFASRPEFWRRVSKAFRSSDYQKQLARLQTLNTARDWNSLRRGVEETGIRWYVVRPSESYPWPDEFLKRPVFEAHGYKVYDMSRCLRQNNEPGS